MGMTGQLRTTIAVLAVAAWAACAAAENRLEYNRDVRPILLDACLACHGPDSAAREADLRLDQREAAVEMGAIVPGDPDASEMIRRILSEDEAERMPPPETKKSLTAQQQATLVRWVREGAEYQPHWSFIAPQRPALPEVENEAWVRTPIDRFIAEKLEAAGLAPAPEADRRALARRLSLDLTGLPPSPEEVAAFVNNAAPDAYERYVDRLMASPRWGEHRGRYWLDVARYGDTHGIHFDNYREMWSYREWVINAFNRNMPFDQFTIENLAGDLVEGATLDQKIGSGFNRCNITTSEGGAIDEEYLVLYTRDRTETTAQAWMGLTAGCAVCHDHKFDPLTQKEFYSLAAFFNNTTQAAMDGNVKDTPPVVFAPLAEDRERWDELQRRSAKTAGRIERRVREARPAFDAWIARVNDKDFNVEPPAEGLELWAPLNDGGDAIAYVAAGKPASAPRPETVEWRRGRLGPQAAYLNKGEALAVADVGAYDADQPFSCAAWVNLPDNDASGALVARMQEDESRGWDIWVEGREIGAHLTHSKGENGIKVLTRAKVPANTWVHLSIVYDGSRRAGGFKIYVDGKPQSINIITDNLTKNIRANGPLKIGQREKASPVSGVALEDVRLYSRALSESEASTLASAVLFRALKLPPDERSQADVDALYDWWLVNRDEERIRLGVERESLLTEQDEIRGRGTVAYVMQEREGPPMANVLFRGEYDQRRDQVAPDTPGFLPPLPADLPRNRLGFAQWLVSPDHPLMARVTVNRFWQELFGTGLVKTAGDFGVSGELPSHPQLLDWLAVEFRESGWDVERLFKLLVTSAAYRQAAVATPDKLERDPDNRLLSRGPRFRMDAEMVRDLALAASGLLVERIGGPSVKPYQPPGIWEALGITTGGANTLNYHRDSGDALYRRSLYTFWKRAAPPASMEVFNAPTREHCVVCRERTNTPLQALVTMNDPQFVEAARRLAERAMQERGPEFDDRTAFIVERVLSRRPRPEEVRVLRRTFDGARAYYAESVDEAQLLIRVGESSADDSLDLAELAAWTIVANQALNLDEAINK